MKSRTSERGVTALFLVIFATILLSVITLSFAQMMVSEQTNSTDNILSQAAYDSATAGVEDAKRTIIACQNAGRTGPICNAIDTHQCDTNRIVTGTPAGQETPIQTSSGGGADLAQAYTCVKIDVHMPDVIRPVKLDAPVMIPLKALGTISQVSIEWQQRGDVGGAVDTSQLGQISSVCHKSSANLCSISGWGAAPALLEAQFILPNTPFKLVDLDANNISQTLYLRPFLTAGSVTASLGAQPQRYAAPAASIATGSPNTPAPVVCNTGLASSYTGGGYACKVTITGLTVTPAQGQASFLRLSAFYRGANVKVTFLDASGAPVPSDWAQAEVDSTGRANDVYRRISSRLDFGDDSAFPLPQNAVDLGGSLCKDFGVTTTGVSTASTCTP